MSKVFFSTTMSLDGFIAGDNRGPQNPLGDGGPAIHSWAYKQKAFSKHLGVEGGEEEGEVHWPEDLYKTPVYVLTHEKREP